MLAELMRIEKELASQPRKEGESSKGKVKRYNLVLPSALFDEVQTLANDERVPILELLKRFIKIGLLITKFSQSPGASLILREGDKERELILV